MKARQSTLQKQRGATRGPQRNHQHGKRPPNIRAPPRAPPRAPSASQGKKQQSRLAGRQTGDEEDDGNVVSISELRNILRLAEPMAVADDATVKATASFVYEKRDYSEGLGVKTRVFPTAHPTPEVSVSEKKPVVNLQRQSTVQGVSLVVDRHTVTYCIGSVFDGGRG